MLEKKLLNQLLSGITHGSVVVNFWDSESRKYGKGSTSLAVKIHDRRVVWDIVRNPSLGFAKAYIDGRITVEGGLPKIADLLNHNRVLQKRALRGRRLRVSKKLHKSYIEKHYDIGNEFFQRILDPTMQYSCADFSAKSQDLFGAQQYKTEVVLRTLNLRPGDRMLDIGSGWGYLSVEAAHKYRAVVTGITLSKEQVRFSNELATARKVDKQVHFQLLNFLDHKTDKHYDAVASIESLESVGKPHVPQYIQTMSGLMRAGAKAVIQTCVMENGPGLTEPFLDKYVFNGVYVPAKSELLQLLEKNRLRVESIDKILHDYERTTAFWYQNLQNNRVWIQSTYGHKLYRIFELYLGTLVGAARYGGDLNTIRIVATKT